MEDHEYCRDTGRNDSQADRRLRITLRRWRENGRGIFPASASADPVR
jgi:hypothetical protein